MDVLTRLRLETAMMMFLIRISSPQKKYDILRVTNAIMDHFLHGVVTQKGLQIIEKI